METSTIIALVNGAGLAIFLAWFARRSQNKSERNAKQIADGKEATIQLGTTITTTFEAWDKMVKAYETRLAKTEEMIIRADERTLLARAETKEEAKCRVTCEKDLREIQVHARLNGWKLTNGWEKAE